MTGTRKSLATRSHLGGCSRFSTAHAAISLGRSKPLDEVIDN